MIYNVGIMLPADQSKPRLVWIKRDDKMENETSSPNPLVTVVKAKSTSLVRPFLGLTDQDAEEFTLTTDHDLGGKFRLPYELQAASRKLDAETEPNKCVESLVGILAASFWKGPVILTRFFRLGGGGNGNDGETGNSGTGSSVVVGESQEVEDMTLADFTHAMGLLEAANVAELEVDDRGG